MTSDNKKWGNLKGQYLNKVEKTLSSVKHPHTTEVLEDLQSHLDQRFSELKADEKTKENIEIKRFARMEVGEEAETTE